MPATRPPPVSLVCRLACLPHATMAAENGAPQPLEFKKVAVFCGASSGTSPAYLEAAKALGDEMVRRGIGLVYGGEELGSDFLLLGYGKSMRSNGCVHMPTQCRLECSASAPCHAMPAGRMRHHGCNHTSPIARCASLDRVPLQAATWGSWGR